ncbi:MAG: cysteine desulfurase-like protein [Planctomycetota bacterium]|nr:cysteine desulfurase-like protein [Planctomycetota bacterium]
MASLNLDQIRSQFPAFERRVGGASAIYLDGPAGSQVPRRVGDAVANYLLRTNANHGAPFATGVESDQVLDQAHRAVADFLGADDPDCVFFGANMTTLTLALSRAIGRQWQPGDEVLVSRLDHDANVSPWVLAARDAGAEVKHIAVRPEDCTLDLDDFASKLTDRTRLVAVGYASNLAGTINPLKRIIEAAHAVGSLVFVDAVHYAPHGLIDVADLGCDFLACSAYKFFGPHVGVIWGRRELLESISPYKLRPSTNELPGRWMTGTQNHEGIAGTTEAVNYLADIGRAASPSVVVRRSAIVSAFSAIETHERTLAAEVLTRIQRYEGVKVWGITDPLRLAERVPTISFTHDRLTPRRIAEALAERGIFTWDGNHYAMPLTEALGLEPHGTLRIGLLHYNTVGEVDRLFEVLDEILRQPAIHNLPGTVG